MLVCGLCPFVGHSLQGVVTVEARDELRYAYCSSVKLIPAERLSRLINPSHMEQMFRRIGAKSNAFATEEVVQTSCDSILLSMCNSLS